MDWLIFVLAFVGFFASHALPVRPAIKARIVSKTSARSFTIGYSLLSLVMLTLLIWAAGRAPIVPLWSLALWHKYVVLAGMLGVCLLLAFSIARPNPFSFGGAQNERFDPKRPGVIRWTRHPLLIALTLWAGLHILPNGDLAHVILFGVFLGFALLGRRIVDARKQRLLGHDTWSTLRDQTKAAPYFCKPQSLGAFALRGSIGVALWCVLILAHPSVIGVSPLP